MGKGNPWDSASMKIAIKVLVIISLLVGVGLYRLDSLNKIPVKVENYSTFNLVEIYVLGIIMSAIAYPIYPEISIEHLSLYSEEKEDRESDFFLRSRVVQAAIRNYDGPVKLFWNTKDYVIGSDEARVALALNGGILKKVGENITVEVPIRYPRDALVKLAPGIKVQEGLFWVLQQKGWYHPGTMAWTARVSSK